MYDLVIIGGGPAGMTAAVYAARKKLKTLIMAESYGGLAMWSPGVENYLGYQYITGRELVQKFEEHLNRFDVTKIKGLAISVLKTENRFKTITTDQREFMSKAVLVATGRTVRYIDVPGEKEFFSRGVTYCSVCDGPLFSGMDVAVVGGGDSAFEAAIQMAAIATRVYLIAKDRINASEIIIDKVKALSNVEMLIPAEIKQILGEQLVTSIQVLVGEDAKPREIPVRGVLIEVGSIPVATFIGDLVEVNDRGEIVIDCLGRTKTPGVFAAGDVTHVPAKQIIIAAGEGAKAALTAYSYIIEQ